MARLVYHYTEPDGLFGIVESGELWATDLRFVNDITEVRYGLELATRAIAELRLAAGPTEKRLLALVSEALDLTGSGPLSGPRFAVCFAGHGDLITQWRAYAAFGKGYALGFDLSELSKAGKCEATTYDQAENLNKMTSVLKELLEAYSGSHLPKAEVRVAAARATAQQCLDLALFAKHPSFADEREVRLLVTSGEPRYRVRGNEVVSYACVNLAVGEERRVRGLREVVVGPLASARAEVGVADFLASRGYKDVRVLRSTVPFRG